MLQDNVDIIMPVWNNCEVTQRALESVVRHTSGDWRLIIIDNASTAPTRQYLQDFSRAHKDCITLIRNEENLGFIKATNQGLKASRAAFACLLNNDVVVTDGWLAGLLRVAKLRKTLRRLTARPRRAPNPRAIILWRQTTAWGFVFSSRGRSWRR